MPTSRRQRQASVAVRVVACALIAVVMAFVVWPASAHVSVSPATAAPGSSVESTLVPNEESNADTTKLVMLIPTAHPTPRSSSC